MGPENTDRFSPLVLADRLIGLAMQADSNGCKELAAALLALVDRALDTPPVLASAAVPARTRRKRAQLAPSARFA